LGEATHHTGGRWIPPRTRTALRLALGCLALAALALGGGYAAKQSGFNFFARAFPIGNLKGIRAGSRVRIRGVVTYYDFSSQSLYLQDRTGALHIGSLERDWHLRPGEAIEVSGDAASDFDQNPGPGSVGLSHMRVRMLGESALPAPVEIPAKNFPPSGLGAERTELHGVVRAASREQGHLILDFGLKVNSNVVKGRLNVSVHIPVRILDGGDLDPKTLVDAEATIKGILEPTPSEGNSQSLAFELLVPGVADVRVDKAAPPHPVLMPSLRALFADTSQVSAGHQVQLQGKVAMEDLAHQTLVIADDSGAVSLHTDETTPVKPGDTVEVLGFPSANLHTIFLRNATFRLIEPEESAAGRSRTEQRNPEPQESLPVLTTVERVRELSPAQANLRYPVRLRGVVTYYNAAWHHIFMQDSTSGIFVDSVGQPYDLHVGQMIQVNGITSPGDYAPIVVQPRIQSLGEGHMPSPDRPSVAEAMSGILDGRWVELEGIVHPMRGGQGDGYVSFDLYTDLGPVLVHTSLLLRDIHPEVLTDAKVCARGVMGAIFNQDRQLTGLVLFLPGVDDLAVLQPAPGDPFSVPVRPIDELLQYSPKGSSNHRVRVEGVVSMNPIGDELHIEDSTGGLLVQTDDDSLEMGDLVDAVGYALPGEYSPILREAIIRKIGRGALPAAPGISPQDALSGKFNNQLVAIEGRLLSHVANSKNQEVLVLQNGNIAFNAQLDGGKYAPKLDGLRDGSTVQVTGICAVQTDPSKVEFNDTRVPQSFHLLLRSPDDIQVLRGASWWTPDRGLWAVAVLVLIIAVAVIWVVALRIQVRARTDELVRAEKLAALGQLAAGVAHELNNPLTGILGYIQILLDDSRTNVHREKLGKVQREARRMKRIIENLINFAHPAVSGGQPSDIETIVERALVLCEHNLKSRDIKVHINFASRLPLLDLDETQFTEVFLNLFNNSADALEEVSDRRISVEGSLEGDDLEVRFSDTGPGFADASRAFDPFYTTKSVGKGAGLGLSTCYGIVTEHGGKIQAQNLKPCGAEVTIKFPAAKTTYPNEKEQFPDVAAVSR